MEPLARAGLALIAIVCYAVFWWIYRKKEDGT